MPIVKVYSALYLTLKKNPTIPDAAPTYSRKIRLLGYDEGVSEAVSERFTRIFDSSQLSRGVIVNARQHSLNINGTEHVVSISDAENSQSYIIVSHVVDTSDPGRDEFIKAEEDAWVVDPFSWDDWRLKVLRDWE